MTYAITVYLQVVEPFLPLSLSPVPNKSKLIQSLASFGNHFVFVLTLNTHPLTETKPIFYMVIRYAAVTLTLLIQC